MEFCSHLRVKEAGGRLNDANGVVEGPDLVDSLVDLNNSHDL